MPESGLPDELQAYLAVLTEEEKSPAFIKVNKEGEILEFGGNLEQYGITGLEAGRYYGDQLIHLEGFLPVFDEPMILPSMMFDSGAYTDLHLLPGEDADWVLMIDSTADVQQRQMLQQKANELALLRTKTSKLLEAGDTGEEGGTSEASKVLGVEESGERKKVAILFANLRGFTRFSEQHDPKLVFRTLNSHLRLIIKLITEEAGFVDNILGDTLTATFGLLPSNDVAQQQAVRAACRVEREFGRAVSGDEASGGLKLGIGIASGDVSYGVAGTEQRRAFSAIGHRVNMAAQLEGQAKPGEILIDANTYERLTPERQAEFESIELFFRSREGLTAAYSRQLRADGLVGDWKIHGQ